MAVAAAATPASAEHIDIVGYAAEGYGHDVSHTGYPGGASSETSAEVDTGSTNYIVIEVEDGTPTEVEGQTVIVVQEPEPVAATDKAPPPVPRAVDGAQPVCPNGIWVDGHWAYANGQYVWVDGHCVVERVNYVFVHPRWDFYANVWWFVPGYYRPCRVWVGYGYYRPYHWFPPYRHTHYRGYRGVPVRRAPYRPTVARPVPAARGPVTTNRIPTVGRSVPTRAGTVGRTPTRVTGVSRVPPTGTRTVTRSTTSRAPVVRTQPPRSTSVARTTPTRAAPSRTMTTRTGTVDRGSFGRSRYGTVSRTPSSVGRSSTVRRSSSSRVGGTRPSTSPFRTNTVSRPSFGSSRGSDFFGRSSSTGRSMPSMRSGGFSRPTSIGGGGARTAPISRGR
jgi:hypothetical protein